MNSDTEKGMRFFVLYDARACNGAGTDEASVLVAIGNCREAEAFKEARSYDFGMSALYSYRDIGGELTNQRFEGNLP